MKKPSQIELHSGETEHYLQALVRYLLQHLEHSHSIRYVSTSYLQVLSSCFSGAILFEEVVSNLPLSISHSQELLQGGLLLVLTGRSLEVISCAVVYEA